MSTPISGEGETTATGRLDGRSTINIAPVGANLGELLQPITQGGATNGGGYSPRSRYLPSNMPATYQPTDYYRQPSSGGMQWVIIGGIALALGAGAFLIFRRG